MKAGPALPLLAALSACTPSPQGKTPDPLAAVPGARIGDPAVAAAVTAPIMADPGLRQMANADTIRPPTTPDPLSVPPDDLGMPAAMSGAGLVSAPAAIGGCALCRAARGALTLGELAARVGTRRCAAGIGYASDWALNLPAGVALPPDARIVEGAGTDAAGCRVRAVTLISASPAGRMLDWFHTQGVKGGFAVRHQTDADLHALTIRRGSVTVATFVSPSPAGGSDVRLVTIGG